MIDLKYAQDNLDELRRKTAARKVEFDFDKLEALSESRRQSIYAFETLRAEQKEAGKAMGSLKPGSDDFNELRRRLKTMSDDIKNLDETRKQVELALDDHLAHLPNLLDDRVPEGQSEDDNVVVSTNGTPRVFEFAVRDHVDLGETLGILDMERAAAVSGARFSYLRGAGARLERALANMMLEVHTQEHGYEEFWTPYLVHAPAMFGTGQLPKFADDAFQTGDHFLIPTAEVTLTNYFREQILDNLDETIRVCSYTPCFRREAGSHGRDTRGLIRQHQFDKVELVKLTTPDRSEDEHQSLVREACAILERLELPYRIVELCEGDVGFSAARCYDIEVWVPSQETYREISSCSNFGDFQARRAGIRYRDADGKPQFVHTLNGSALAVGRTWLAVLENFQEADGSVTIPDALRSFMGCDRITV